MESNSLIRFEILINKVNELTENILYLYSITIYIYIYNFEWDQYL